MIVEIKDIKTSAMCVAIAALRESGMRALAEALMLWAFEVEGPTYEVPDLDHEQLNRVQIIMDHACDAYSLRIDDYEFTRREIADDEKINIEEIREDDEEPAAELPTMEELRVSSAPGTTLVMATNIKTDQADDVVGLIRDSGMLEIATLMERAIQHRDAVTQWLVPTPTERQISTLRNILNSLCDTYRVCIGSTELCK